MGNSTTVKVIGADRLNDALIITFSDGRCGKYSSKLLYDTLGLAVELYETQPPKDLETDNLHSDVPTDLCLLSSLKAVNLLKP